MKRILLPVLMAGVMMLGIVSIGEAAKLDLTFNVQGPGNQATVGVTLKEEKIELLGTPAEIFVGKYFPHFRGWNWKAEIRANEGFGVWKWGPLYPIAGIEGEIPEQGKGTTKAFIGLKFLGKLSETVEVNVTIAKVLLPDIEVRILELEFRF